MIADCWLVVSSTFLRSCKTIKSKNVYSTEHSSLFSKWSNDLCSSSFQACFEHCWNQAANKLSLADKNNKLLDVIDTYGNSKAKVIVPKFLVDSVVS